MFAKQERSIANSNFSVSNTLLIHLQPLLLSYLWSSEFNWQTKANCYKSQLLVAHTAHSGVRTPACMLFM